MIEAKIINLGLIDYKKAWDYQEFLFNKIIEAKRNNQEHDNYLIFCEHPHVYTLGKNGNENNLLINSKKLKEKKILLYRTNRGGDITYHGPGQLVGYPIFNLNNFYIGLKEYVRRIEEIIILTLNDFNLESSRKKSSTGVWINADNHLNVKKICSIGIKSSHFVTMHGFALNINTNLEYYKYINPCGFSNKMVTSMKNELNSPVNFDQVLKKILVNFQNTF